MVNVSIRGMEIGRLLYFFQFYVDGVKLNQSFANDPRFTLSRIRERCIDIL